MSTSPRRTRTSPGKTGCGPILTAPPDALGDWLTARVNLQRDRTARLAYFRWMARVARGDQTDDATGDWLAGENAALYGDATLRAARAHFVSYVRPGGALPTIAVGNQPYGLLAVTALDDWQPRATEQRMRGFIGALRALRGLGLAAVCRDRPPAVAAAVHRCGRRAGNAPPNSGHQPAQPADLRPRAGR